MSRRRSAVELEELAKIKRSQAAARLAHRTANPKPYTPKPDIDYTQLYYRDPLEPSRFLKMRVANGTLTLWGGITAAGLVTVPPANSAIVEITRGNKIPIVKVRWYYGDDTAVVVPANEMHGRWVKFYDEKNGQSHHQIPFVSAAEGAAPNMASTITAFYAKLNTAAEVERIIGTRGRAELVIGYGRQYTTLARVSA